MLNCIDTQNDLKVRLVDFSMKEYLFVLQTVLGEDHRVAYALVYDTEEYEKKARGEELESFLDSYSKKAEDLLATQNCRQLSEYINQEYRLDIQAQSNTLSDYKYTGAEVQRLLNNLLKERSSELSEASVRDIIALLKAMYETGALESGDAFEQHFITVPKKYDSLCVKCNHEFYATEGLNIKCPNCGQVYTWSEEEQRFYPSVGHL